MKIKKKGKHRLFSSLFFLNFILIFVSFPFTQTQAVSISPLRHTITIDAGQSEVVDILITNDEEERIVLIPEIDAFTIDQKTGAAIFGAVDIAKQWIIADNKEIILKPKEKKEVLFKINVPQNAKSGGHYLGLFVKQLAGDGQVGASSRIGTLLFLYVGGEIQESLVRKEFFSDKSWYITPKIKLFLQLKNNGDIHTFPTGDLVLSTHSGKKINTVQINPETRKVFPNSLWVGEYIFDNLTWKDAGLIRANVDISYGLTEQKIFDSISFWFIPAEIIIAASLAILIFILFVMMISIKKRSGQ